MNYRTERYDWQENFTAIISFLVYIDIGDSLKVKVNLRWNQEMFATKLFFLFRFLGALVPLWREEKREQT